MAAKSRRALSKKRTRSRLWKRANPDYQKNWHLQKNYGITLDAFLSMLAGQGGQCMICHRPESLQVDHDHDTGKIRGLLCGECNRALGLVSEDINRLQRMIDYLKGSM